MACAYGRGVPARRTLNRNNAGIRPFAVYIRSFLALQIGLPALKLCNAKPLGISMLKGLGHDSASLQVATSRCCAFAIVLDGVVTLHGRSGHITMPSRTLLGRSSRGRCTFRRGFLFNLAKFMRKSPASRTRLVLRSEQKFI